MNNLNNNGFSMVQIMMAAGMMSILSLGMMKMMENQKLSSKSLQATGAATSFYNEAKSFLGRPGYCSKNFEGVTLKEGDSFELDNILKSNGEVLYKKGALYEAGVLRLNSISTKKYEHDTEFTGLMHLVFKLDKVGKSYGAKSFTKIVKLTFNLDSSGKVKSCSTLGSPTNFGFEGTKKALDTEQAIKDLHSGKVTEDSDKLKNLIDNNAALKEMSKSLKIMKETQKKMEEMLKE